MAQVRLDRYEAEDGRLPRVCMRCGERATTEKRKTFSWYPPWAYFILLAGALPFVIVVLVITKRMTVYVPFCEGHKHHWLWRNLAVLGTLLLVAVVGVFAVVLLGEAGNRRGGGQDWSGWICLGTVLLLIAWLIFVAIVSSTAIRPKEITHRTITLTGVDGRFVDALEQADDEEPDSRPRKSSRFGDYGRHFDPDGPRRRDYPPDSYREDDE